MAGVLKFPVTDKFKALVEAAKTSGAPVNFAKDHGAYLCVHAGKKAGDHDTHVVYAEGCDPKIDKDFYDVARDVVGGDDCVEAIDLDFLKKVVDGKAASMEIQFTASKMTLQAYR